MKWLVSGRLLAMAGGATPQAPDVVINLDARLNYRTAPESPNTQRLYDELGNYSIVSLGFKLEPGFKVYVGQKLQRFSGGHDDDLLDEYYVEDEGIWRVGKQYVPFGANRLVRESVLAARGDTNLLIEGIPVRFAYCQGGGGKQEGFVGRVGGRIGFSAFIGDHFGIDGTSFGLIRRPESASGRGRGYGQAYGVDMSKGNGPLMFTFEGVAFRQPSKDELDHAFEAYDLSCTYTPSKYQTYILGWTRKTNPNDDIIRLQASIFATRNVFIEPMLRYRDGKTYDLNIAIRVRL